VKRSWEGREKPKSGGGIKSAYRQRPAVAFGAAKSPSNQDNSSKIRFRGEGAIPSNAGAVFAGFPIAARNVEILAGASAGRCSSLLKGSGNRLRDMVSRWQIKKHNRSRSPW